MNDESRTIYVVDDDPAVLASLAELFSSLPCQVQSFRTARDFLSGFRDGHIACLVLDLRMPDMTGVSVLQALNDDGIQVPTVVITAFGDVRSAVDAMKAGAVDFLEKPFDPQTLLQRVEEALRKSEAQVRLQRQRHVLLTLLKSLTAREREVLGLLNDGFSNKEIAIRLGISDKTVSAHRAAVLTKLRCKSTTEIARCLTRFSIDLAEPDAPPASHPRAGSA